MCLKREPWGIQENIYLYTSYCTILSLHERDIIFSLWENFVICYFPIYSRIFFLCSHLFLFHPFGATVIRFSHSGMPLWSLERMDREKRIFSMRFTGHREGVFFLISSVYRNLSWCTVMSILLITQQQSIEKHERRPISFRGKNSQSQNISSYSRYEPWYFRHLIWISHIFRHRCEEIILTQYSNVHMPNSAPHDESMNGYYAREMLFSSLSERTVQIRMISISGMKSSQTLLNDTSSTVRNGSEK